MKTKIILLLTLLLPVIYLSAQSNKLFGSYWTGSEEIFTSLDISTKTYTDIDTLDGVLTLNFGENTFDTDNGRYFRKTNLGITIVDVQSGDIIDTIANPNNMKGIEYDKASNKLFGSYWTGSEEIFTSLDISTKTYTDIDTLDGVLTLNVGESTFDTDNGRYFIKTNLGITIVDVQNGDIIDTITNPNNMKGIEFSNTILTLKIIENTFANELLVYPNPTNGLVNLNLQTSYTNLTIEIINTSGQIIYKQNFNKSTDLKLDLTELVVGVHFVKIYAEDKSTTIKLIKK